MRAGVVSMGVMFFGATMCCAMTGAHASSLYPTNESVPVVANPHTYQPPDVANPLNVAIFKDHQPWGNAIDEQILVANDIAYTVFNRDAIGAVDLEPFDKVILSNQQGADFNTAVQAASGWFDAYVESGGCLLYGLAHFSGDLVLGVEGPGGFGLAVESRNEIVEILLPGHPLFNEPNSGVNLNFWEFSTHGDLMLPPGHTALVRNLDDSSGIALAERGLGGGYVLATSQPYQWFGADPDYAENIVLYQPCGSVPISPSSWARIKSVFDE